MGDDPVTGAATDHRSVERLCVPVHNDGSLVDVGPLPGMPVLPAAAAGFATPTALGEQLAALADRVASASGPPPEVWSGDCVWAIGVLAGAQRRHGEVGLVWLDAHGDFHTPETSSSGYLGGMILAMIVGRGPQDAVRAAGLRPLPESRVTLVGARHLEESEERALRASQIVRVGVADLDPAVLPDGPLVLHVDVDVTDGAAVPGLRYPAADGPGPAAVAAAVAAVQGTGRVVARSSASTWDLSGLPPDDRRAAIARRDLIAGAPAPR